MPISPAKIPTGNPPASWPGSEEIFLTAYPSDNANAASFIVAKDAAGVETIVGTRLLQLDGSAYPSDLLPPTGEVYEFYDTNTGLVSTVNHAGTVQPVTAGNYTVMGDIDCSGNPNYPAASQGDAYRVSVAGKIGGASGAIVELGDVIVAFNDNPGGTQAAVGADWNIDQANITPNTDLTVKTLTTSGAITSGGTITTATITGSGGGSTNLDIDSVQTTMSGSLIVDSNIRTGSNLIVDGTAEIDGAEGLVCNKVHTNVLLSLEGGNGGGTGVVNLGKSGEKIAFFQDAGAAKQTIDTTKIDGGLADTIAALAAYGMVTVIS